MQTIENSKKEFEIEKEHFERIKEIEESKLKAELEEFGIRVVTTPKKVTLEDKIDENTIISQSVKKGKRLKKDNGVIELVYAVLMTVYPDFTDGTYDKDLIQQFCDDNKITCIFKENEDKVLAP